MPIQRIAFAQTQDQRLVRVLHDLEKSSTTFRDGLPEVFSLLKTDKLNPPAEGSSITLTQDWQLLSRAMNPDLPVNKWTNMYAMGVALANKQGFPHDAGDQPKANYVTGENLDSPDPKLDIPRTCGGATHSVIGEVGNYWILETLQGAAPTLDFMISHPWLKFDITTARNNGTVGVLGGDGYQKHTMLVSAEAVMIIKEKCIEVPWMCDPYFLGTKKL